MIIDAHCHAGRGDILTAPWDSDCPIETHLHRAREAGIARTVVFPIHNRDMERANEEVAGIVRQHPNELTQVTRSGGFCHDFRWGEPRS